MGATLYASARSQAATARIGDSVPIAPCRGLPLTCAPVGYRCAPPRPTISRCRHPLIPILKLLSLPYINLDIMNHLHSTLRYLILVFLVASVLISLMKMMGKKPFTKGDKMTYLMTLIFCHVQLIVGFVLFIMKDYHKRFSQMGAIMKEPVPRFFTIEHTLMMLLAIVFITIGYSSAKRATADLAKHKKTFIFYLIGLLLIIAAIPWPFRNLGNFGWL